MIIIWQETMPLGSLLLFIFSLNLNQRLILGSFILKSTLDLERCLAETNQDQRTVLIQMVPFDRCCQMLQKMFPKTEIFFFPLQIVLLATSLKYSKQEGLHIQDTRFYLLLIFNAMFFLRCCLCVSIISYSVWTDALRMLESGFLTHVNLDDVQMYLIYVVFSFVQN